MTSQVAGLAPNPSRRRLLGGLSRRQKREAFEFYLLVTPWVFGFVCLTIGPMIYSLFLSFTDYDLFHPPRWIGLGNFQHLFFKPPPTSVFWKSLSVTAYYTFLTVPMGIIGSLILAMMLNTRIRGIPLYRTVFYLPSLTPSVASALLWVWIFNSRYGLANAALRLVGLPPLHWLSDPYTVIPSLFLMDLWGLGGNTAVIFLAGLQGVSTQLYDAAQIDGANWWNRFWHVTVPQISPTIFFNMILGFIGTFQAFNAAFLMTDGGPDYASYFMGYYIYQEAFRSLHMGRGAALAWILFVILLVFTLIQFTLSNRWVYYEGGAPQ